MTRMLYQPPFFGMSAEKPVEVEIVELDFEKGSAVVLVPVGSDTLANVFRREAGEPEIDFVRRTVPRSSLRPISR